MILNDEEILQIYQERNWRIFEPDLYRSQVMAQAQKDLDDREWVEWIEANTVGTVHIPRSGERGYDTSHLKLNWEAWQARKKEVMGE